jgi:hypothetical protein
MNVPSCILTIEHGSAFFDDASMSLPNTNGCAAPDSSHVESASVVTYDFSRASVCCKIDAIC